MVRFADIRMLPLVLILGEIMVISTVIIPDESNEKIAYMFVIPAGLWVTFILANIFVNSLVKE